MKKIKPFPKDFFKKERPSITFEEATKDDIPYEWPNEVIKGDKIVTPYSTKKENLPKK